MREKLLLLSFIPLTLIRIPILLQDFDLCVSCKDKDGHPHPMEKLGFDLDDGSSPADAKQTNPQVTYWLILKISMLQLQ